MSELTPEILQMGTVAILFLLFIKEFFAYLRNRKNNNNNNGSIIKTLKLLEDNHLNTINGKVDRLDDKLDKIINLLVEIKTKLNK